MKNTQQIITTSDVSINTASIEVKVMKIGNRQVTLAVFRQLPEEQIIHKDTGALKGLPWGRVNYHPDKCEEWSDHLHIVWQKENELRRAMVHPNWSKHCVLPRTVDEYARAYAYACLIEGNLGPLCEWDSRRKCVTMSVDAKAFGIGQYHFYVNCSYDGGVANDKVWGDTRLDMLAYLDVRDLPHNSSILFTEYFMPAAKRLPALAQTWQASYTQLEQLDQLFIAV